MKNQILDQKTLSLILSNQTARLELVKKSHKSFFGTYFPHYVSYPCADLHHELLEMTEDATNRFAVVLTFRGSGKSTYVSLSYALWAILGEHNKHFVVLVAKTQEQAKRLLDAIKREVENNELFRRDFGGVNEEATPWNSTALTFPGYDAQITAISIDQAMRGMRYSNYRPDVIILDDIEDAASVRTLESRDRLQEWFDKDLLPAGDLGTRVILVGNNLHPDSLPNRIIDRVQNGQFDAKIIKCPLVNEQGVCAWPGKFPTKESLDQFRMSFTSERTWRQEFLLQPVLSEEAIVGEKDFESYEGLPEYDEDEEMYAAIGIDLACSLDKTADKTAMIAARVYGRGDGMRIYLLPNVVNARFEIHDSIARCFKLAKTISVDGSDGLGSVRVFPEAVGFQKTFPQQLVSRGMRRVEEFHPGSIGSKRDRLFIAADLIKSGQILFPKYGLEELKGQIISFGAERHDDLVDAFTALVIKAIENNPRESNINVLVGDLNHIYTAEELRIQRENERDGRRVDLKGYDYWVKLSEAHTRGEVLDLGITNPWLRKNKESKPKQPPRKTS